MITCDGRRTDLRLPPALQPAARSAQCYSGKHVGSLTGLVAPLLWLLLTHFLRNMFPAVRISSCGVLVRWSGDWVPIQWEGLQALRVTNAEGGSKFVVLA